MKVMKSIGLFFAYPLAMFGFGFATGAEAVHHESIRIADQTEFDRVFDVASIKGETLWVDTEYVLTRRDIPGDARVENVLRLPSQYVGMNREQFVTAIDNLSNYPPLEEQEKGFISAEVLAFSRDRVSVQMNYAYKSVGNEFYLAVRDNEVVVYLEDKQTIYMNTGIPMERLPEDLQLKLIEMLYMDSEARLYTFLETYSS